MGLTKTRSGPLAGRAAASGSGSDRIGIVVPKVARGRPWAPPLAAFVGNAIPARNAPRKTPIPRWVRGAAVTCLIHPIPYEHASAVVSPRFCPRCAPRGVCARRRSPPSRRARLCAGDRVWGFGRHAVRVPFFGCRPTGHMRGGCIAASLRAAAGMFFHGPCTLPLSLSPRAVRAALHRLASLRTCVFRHRAVGGRGVSDAAFSRSRRMCGAVVPASGCIAPSSELVCGAFARRAACGVLHCSCRNRRAFFARVTCTRAARWCRLGTPTFCYRW